MFVSTPKLEATATLKFSGEERRLMKYGIVIEDTDYRVAVRMAQEAEQAGWDGFFVPDAIAIEVEGMPSMPWFDPWVVLASIAVQTSRIRIGTFITPISRRRPWKLAREAMTLDHLSAGRLTIGVGLGAAEDDGGFKKVGEAMDLKVRAELMDEGLSILDGLWSGEPFSFEGTHYHVDRMTMLPVPVQSPRIPIWVIGVWPKGKSLGRALEWDGIIPQKYKAKPGDSPKPSDIEALAKYVAERRNKTSSFDIIAGGMTLNQSRKRAVETVRSFRDAGATWWMESIWLTDSAPLEKTLALIAKGPPK